MPTCLKVSSCKPPLIPKQNIQIPIRQQKKSKKVGFLLGYCCEKVETAQIIRAAGQKIKPDRVQLQEQLPSLAFGVGVTVLYGYWLFGQQQSNRQDWLNCCELKERLMTRGPTPMTGRKLKMQERQQRMPQPGRQGGLLTTPSHLHITQLVKKFLNSIYPTRQQNSTSVTLANMVIPTKYPSRQNCTNANIGFAYSTLTLALIPSSPAYNIKSSTGQPQIIRYSQPGFMFLTSWLKIDGIRQEQKKQRIAMQRQGRVEESREFRRKGRLFIRVKIRVSRAVKAKNMYYWYIVGMKIVRRISAASIKHTAMAQVTYFTILLLGVSQMRCSMNIAKGSFHISQPKTRLSAIAVAVLSQSPVQIPIEDSISLRTELSQALDVPSASIQGEMAYQIVQQGDAWIVTAYFEIAQMAAQTPTATTKITHDRMYHRQGRAGSGSGYTTCSLTGSAWEFSGCSSIAWVGCYYLIIGLAVVGL